MSRAQRFLRSMKSMMARENKFTVTPKKGSGSGSAGKWRPSGGGGSVAGPDGEDGKQQAGAQLISQ